MTMSKYFATGYDSAADEVIALLSDESEGYGAASTGEVDSPTGRVQLVHLDDTMDLDFADTTGAYPLGDDVGEAAREYGVTAEDVIGSYIVTYIDQGFVYVERFETRDLATERYEALGDEYSAWLDADESGV